MWYEAWHLSWQRFRYWRAQLGFIAGYNKIKLEQECKNERRFGTVAK